MTRAARWRGWRRLARGAVIGIAAAGVAAVGWLWHHDRSRVWVPPRWDASRFVLLGGESRAPEPPRERWLVAVNLGCPHCLESLRHAAAARVRRSGGTALEALVVDSATRPAARNLPEIPGVRWWWDSGAIWRSRWGHRIYGEIVVFDGAGSCLRTLPPMLAEPPGEAANLGVPPDDL